MLAWWTRVGIGYLLAFYVLVVFAILVPEFSQRINYYVLAATYMIGHWGLFGLGIVAVNVCSNLVTRATKELPNIENTDYRQGRFALCLVQLIPIVVVRWTAEFIETFLEERSLLTKYTSPYYWQTDYEQTAAALGWALETATTEAAGMFCSLVWVCAILALQPHRPHLSWIYQAVLIPGSLVAFVLQVLGYDHGGYGLLTSRLIGWMIGFGMICLLCLALQNKNKIERPVYGAICLCALLGVSLPGIEVSSYDMANVLATLSGVVSGFFTQVALMHAVQTLFSNQFGRLEGYIPYTIPVLCNTLVPIVVASALFALVYRFLLRQPTVSKPIRI